MRRLRAFAAFWYEFVVGDDWRVAVGLAIALGATALLAEQDVAAWWPMPLAVIALLAESLREQPANTVEPVKENTTEREREMRPGVRDLCEVHVAAGGERFRAQRPDSAQTG